MAQYIRSLMLLVVWCSVAASWPVLAQNRKPIKPVRPVQSRDKLHELAKKSGGHFVLRYRPSRNTIYANLEELARRSDLIVIGRTLRHRSRLRPDGNFITEDYLVRVHEVIKGNLLPGRSITVSLPGGSYRFSDGSYVTVMHMDQRAIEDQGIYVFFLKSKSAISPYNGHLLVSETQGLFGLTEGRVAVRTLARDDPAVLKYQDMSASNFLREIHKTVPRRNK